MINYGKLTAVALSTLAMVAAAQPASAHDRAANATAGTAASARVSPGQAPEAKKYCVTLEASTGTRMPKRQCRTKAEWAIQGIEVGPKG